MPDDQDFAHESLPKEIQVGDFTVRKLVTGDYVKVSHIFKKIPRDVQSKLQATQDAADAGDVNEALGSFIELLQIVPDILPDLIEAVAISTGKDIEEIEQLEVEVTFELLLAVYQVNDFSKTWDKLKKKAQKDRTQ